MLFIWALHLALVLQGGFSAAVQPLRSSPGNEDKRMKWCDEHKAFHNRLDIVEETLDKTVEHLESEVKNLLNLMNSIAWNLPPESGSPTENFLGDGGKLDMTGSCRLFSFADEQGKLPADKEEDAGGGEMCHEVHISQKSLRNIWGKGVTCVETLDKICSCHSTLPLDP